MSQTSEISSRKRVTKASTASPAAAVEAIVGPGEHSPESLFRALIEQLPAITYIAEAGAFGRWHYVSPQLEKWLGYSPEEWLANPSLWFQRILPEDRNRVLLDEERTRQQGVPLDSVYRIRARDSRVLWFRDRAEVMKDSSGQRLFLQGVIFDVTAEKLAEEKLQESEAQLAAAQRLTHAGSWVMELDPQSGEPTAWRVSSEFYTIFGCEPESVAINGEFFQKNIHPDDREMVHKTLLEAVGRREPFVSDYRIVRSDGAVRYLHEEGQFVSDEAAGKPVRIVGYTQDVTERRQMEEQLRHSQKMEAVGRLAGGVAHDFNNTLMVIKGYSELLMEKMGDAGPLLRHVAEVHKATDRAAALTRQLLAFSRMQVLEPRILALNEIVSELGGMMPRIFGAAIELRLELGPGLSRIRADRGQIEQVLMNLAVNARDAMPQGGRLTIETSNVRLDEAYTRLHPGVLAGDYVLLAVSDTGVGMSEATKARLFEPFFTTKEMGKGTGLGLATVYGIVKQSGGWIWVYSQLGRGTSFKIYLPAVDQMAVSEPLRMPQPVRPGGTETILVVEDQQAVRELAASYLRSLGYTVLEAPDGHEALRIESEYKSTIHVLLTDMTMPRMTGTHLAEKISERRPGVRVLLMSGFSEFITKDAPELPPGAGAIQKPFSLDSLARKLRELLEARPQQN